MHCTVVVLRLFGVQAPDSLRTAKAVTVALETTDLSCNLADPISHAERGPHFVAQDRCILNSIKCSQFGISQISDGSNISYCTKFAGFTANLSITNPFEVIAVGFLFSFGFSLITLHNSFHFFTFL